MPNSSLDPTRIAATPLSGVSRERARAAGRFAPSAHLARRWLALGLVASAIPMLSSACLVTSKPQIEQSQATAPFLVAASADPDAREFIRLDDDTPITLSADVLSDDGDRRVQTALYVDYGLQNPKLPQWPYALAIPGNSFAPATLADGPRRLHQTFVPSIYKLESGCHTLTLIVSHEFDQSTDLRYCPTSLADSSQLTWYLLKCDAPGNCPTIDLASAKQSCPVATVACPPTSGAGATIASPGDAGAP